MPCLSHSKGVRPSVCQTLLAHQNNASYHEIFTVWSVKDSATRIRKARLIATKINDVG